MLRELRALKGHVFWDDDVPLSDSTVFAGMMLAVHRQITDAYLVELAHHQHGRLATLDKRLGEIVTDIKQRARLIDLVQ